MGAPAKRHATYEDLVAAPEHLVAELIDGDLYTHPRPTALHALASSAIGSELFNRYHDGQGGPGGWIVLFEPELHLHGDVLVPDIAAWRRERLSEVPDAPAFELPPDWACEVLSAATAAVDRVRKMRIYGREAVRHVWPIDPTARTLEVYRLLPASKYELMGAWCDDAMVRAEPFDAVDIDLGRLWRR
jgi:Uma2 family endonuclease